MPAGLRHAQRWLLINLLNSLSRVLLPKTLHGNWPEKFQGACFADDSCPSEQIASHGPSSSSFPQSARPHAVQKCRHVSPAFRRGPHLRVYSPSIPAREIFLLSGQHKPILNDWLRSKTFGPFHDFTDARRMNQHQDSAKSATNRRGRTVVCRKAMWQ
jgi:hypothetical protein